MQICDIVSKANELVANYGTRNPFHLARELDIEIIERNFKTQKGAYKVILNNSFIFIKNDLDPVMKNIVLLHEIGHDIFHREEAIKMGGFKEFDVFSGNDVRMEYEANVFASQILLPDEEILDYVRLGYDAQQISALMNSDINLVALKIDTLNFRGYKFNSIEHKNDFLKYE